MARDLYSASDAIENRQSFYNVIRETGRNECPFWNSLPNAIPFKGDPAKAHEWYFRPNPKTGKSNVYAEGSKRAVITKFPSQKLSNYLQILKQTSGLTGSQLDAMTIEDQSNSLDTQKLANRKQIKLDVETAFLTDAAPVIATDADTYRKNTMAGAVHYAGLVIDGTNTDVFNMKTHITEPLKHMWKEGVTEDKIIMCGPDLKDAINQFFETGKRYNADAKKVTTNVTHIEDSGWGTNIPIIPNANMADGEMIIYAPSLIHPVLLRAIKDRDCADKTYDGVAFEDLFEMTIQVEDPNAIVHIKNIKVS